MGKRYYCDYCDKTMVASPTIVKTHNKGLVHQKLLQEHYQQYKDPETILAEESTKKPCNWFAQGSCQFGSICHYSHYTAQQMNAFREYVSAKEKSKKEVTQPSFEELYLRLQVEKTAQPNTESNTVLYDNNGVTHVFPWTYNNELDNFCDLPLSIMRLKIDNFTSVQINSWG